MGRTFTHRLVAAFLSETGHGTRPADGLRFPGHAHPAGASRRHPPEMDVRCAHPDRFGLGDAAYQPDYFRRSIFYPRQPDHACHPALHVQTRTQNPHGHHDGGKFCLGGGEYFMDDGHAHLQAGFLVDGFPCADDCGRTSRTQPHPAPFPQADPVLRLFHCHYSTWSRNHRRQLRSWHPSKRARTSCSRNLVRPQRHRHPQSAPFHATDTLYRILPVCRVSMVDRRGWVNAWARRAGSGSVLRCDIAHRLRWLCHVDDLRACPYHFPGHRSGPDCF